MTDENRVAQRVNGHRPPDMSKMGARQQMLASLAWRKPNLVKFAHDSGDGETIFHCPFVAAAR